jgi:hypothetical protein
MENNDPSIAAILAEITSGGEPNTYKKALQTPDSNKWELAMQEEYGALMDNGTWELADLPAGRKAIKCKWVYKLKYSGTGELLRHKARLVAKGFTQIHGIDFDETFSPVARLDSVRLLLALAALEDWDIHQIDVKTAFLNGELDEELYMEQPEGFVVPGHRLKVCRLRKAIYGLKQASRVWYLKLKTVLSLIGFDEMITGDVCIFGYRQQVGDINVLTIIIVYVDDMNLLGNNLPHIQQVKSHLNDHFSITDLGDTSYFLGLHITRDRSKRQLHLDQHKYIGDVLTRFQMEECNPAFTPFPTGCVLQKNNSPVDDNDPDFIRQYQSIVGSLMYAMLGTRPDIAFAVNKLSQFGSNPDQSHLKAARHVLRYMKGTKDLILTYGLNQDGSIVGYSDADYAGDPDTRLSTTGYVYLLGGAAIAWTSRKQRTVATSTTEAEYMALSDAAKHAAWTNILCTQLGFDAGLPILLGADNKGSRDLASSPVNNRSTKHIEVRYHFIREKVAEGLIKLFPVSSLDNVADTFTKSFSRDRHKDLVQKLGLHL